MTIYAPSNTASIDPNGVPWLMAHDPATGDVVKIKANPATGALLVEASGVTISWPITVSNEVEITNSSGAPIPMSAYSLPLPSGASTEATLLAMSAKLPASLWQKAMSASTSVTVASDQSPLPTDVRASASAQSVTPSDSTNLTGTARALYVWVGGNIVAIIGGSPITFTNVQDGTILPIACTRINATSTTATNMVALY